MALDGVAHKAGCIVLTLWTTLNLIPSGIIVVSTMFFGGHTPALSLRLSEDEVEALSPDVLATLDSIAVFANCTNVAFCIVALVVIWMGLYRRHRWALWALLAGFGFALLAGVGADYEVGFAAPWVNAISAGILAIGLGLAAVGLFRVR